MYFLFISVLKGKTCTNRLYCNYYTNPCQNNGQCTNDKGSFKCNCQTGYTGSLCQHNFDNCPTVNPCLNGGVCRDRLNGYYCECPTGFTGKTVDYYEGVERVGERIERDGGERVMLWEYFYFSGP